MDCFTDCYKSGIPYSGIRSVVKDGNICNQGTKSNICSFTGESYPRCPIKSSYGECDIPNCSTVTIATGCVKNSNISSFNDSLKVSWSTFGYKGKIIGYITLLHNTDHVCKQYNIQLCNNCSSEKLLEKIKNIHLSCKFGKVESSIKYESHLEKLYQNQEYFVYIMPIVNTFMIGEVKNMTIRTQLAKPVSPQNVHFKSQSTNGIVLLWDKQNNFTRYGEPKYYVINIRLSHSKKIETKKVNETEINIQNLTICSQYCFSLKSVNDAGSSVVSKEKCYYTLAPKPDNVTVGDVKSGYFTNQTLTWSYPRQDNCAKIYRLEYQVNGSALQLTTNESSIKISNLKRNLNYTVKIRAEGQMKTINNENIGEYSQIKEFYTGLLHLNLSFYNKSLDHTNKLLNISWGIIAEMQGSIFEFIIILRNTSKMCVYLVHFQCKNCQSPWNSKSLRDDKKQVRNDLLKCKQNTTTNFNSNAIFFHFLITSEIEFTNFSVEIYGINLLGVHNLNKKETVMKLIDHHQKYLVTIIILSIVTVSISCIVLIIMKQQKSYYLPPKKISNSIPIKRTSKIETYILLPESNKEPVEIKPKKEQKEIGIHLKIQTKESGTAINVAVFAEYYLKLSQNLGADLIIEYKKLGIEAKAVEASLKLTVNAGKNSNNSKKNRFINILPFDQNRVKIRGKEYPDDYINASYIPFIKNEKEIEYIASQGPIDGSLSDFWQMIWEQNINCIAMLTQTTEGDKFKCLQYWPGEVGKSMNYGDKDQFNVTLTNEDDKEGHIERNFIVTNTKSNEKRDVMHLHMHTWLDHSAPNLDYFDKLLFRFQEILHNGNYPYLVHCSAGVGRTGTLICIDRIIKQLGEGCQEINIYQTVLKLRHYRNLLVQRQTQYIFIHDYINHFISKYLRAEQSEEVLYFNEDQ